MKNIYQIKVIFIKKKSLFLSSDIHIFVSYTGMCMSICFHSVVYTVTLLIYFLHYIKSVLSLVVRVQASENKLFKAFFQTLLNFLTEERREVVVINVRLFIVYIFS